MSNIDYIIPMYNILYLYMQKVNIKFSSPCYTHNCIKIFKNPGNSMCYIVGNECIIECHCNECVKFEFSDGIIFGIRKQ